MRSRMSASFAGVFLNVAKVVCTNEHTLGLMLRWRTGKAAPADAPEGKARWSLWSDLYSSILGLIDKRMASPYQRAVDREQATINAESFHQFTFNFLESLSPAGVGGEIEFHSDLCSNVIFIIRTSLTNIPLSISVPLILFIFHLDIYSHLTNVSVCVGLPLHS